MTMDELDLNLRIANCHPFELQWISQLLIALREVESSESEVLEIIAALMYHPHPLDTWNLTIAMFLNNDEVARLSPIVEKIAQDQDYFFSEFVILE